MTILAVELWLSSLLQCSFHFPYRKKKLFLVSRMMCSFLRALFHPTVHYQHNNPHKIIRRLSYLHVFLSRPYPVVLLNIVSTTISIFAPILTFMVRSLYLRHCRRPFSPCLCRRARQYIVIIALVLCN